MKRKDSERSQSTRKKEYNTMKAREEDEPWQSLSVHNINSVQSQQIFEKMYSSSSL